jgi:predicted nucleic acid-binding protein
MARSAPLFVDTSVWVALIHRRDQGHTRAVRLWPQVHRGRRHLVTTALVLSESHALLLHRDGHDTALAFLDGVLTRRHGEVVWPDDEITREASTRWLRAFPDKAFTLTDAVSFEVMRREGIQEAFTFDKDFARAGFTLLG